jgi:hypothetical protein
VNARVATHQSGNESERTLAQYFASARGRRGRCSNRDGVRKGTVGGLNITAYQRKTNRSSLYGAQSAHQALWVVPLTAAAAAEADKDSEANDAVSAIAVQCPRARPFSSQPLLSRGDTTSTISNIEG